MSTSNKKNSKKNNKKMEKYIRSWLLKTKNCTPKRPNIEVKKISKLIATNRQGYRREIKNEHNQILVDKYKEIIKKNIPDIGVQSVLCLDGMSLRTIKSFTRAGVDPTAIVTANYDKRIVANAIKHGVTSSYHDSLENIVSDDYGIDLHGKKFAVIYLDMCQTIFGSKDIGDPNYVFQQCLKHYVTVGSYISMTLSLRNNPTISMDHDKYIKFIKEYVNLQLEKYGWTGVISQSKKYLTNMYYIGIDITGRLDCYIDYNRTKDVELLMEFSRTIPDKVIDLTTDKLTDLIRVLNNETPIVETMIKLMTEPIETLDELSYEETIELHINCKKSKKFIIDE